MIQYIKRKNIDVTKYDACIENSIQSRIYAYSWYLDIVADNWDVLVLNDYEAVMPIAWKQKYFIKYIVQPFFCQQLGVFSISEINENMEMNFINKIPSRYLKLTINFNSKNFVNNFTKSKKNYILNLKYDYDLIFKKFSKTRKQRIKFGLKNNLKVKNVLINDLLEIQKNCYTYEGFSEKTILDLSDGVINLNKGDLIGVYKENILLGGGLFLQSEKRIIYLYSSFNEIGRKNQAASFLIDYVIRENANKNLLLDFEGGNIPNIEIFFKSFGAVPENFHQYSKKRFCI